MNEIVREYHKIETIFERDKYKQANKKAIEYIENLSVGEKRDLLKILEVDK